MANSNRKKARKLQVAKKANAAEREKAAKKVRFRIILLIKPTK